MSCSIKKSYFIALFCFVAGGLYAAESTSAEAALRAQIRTLALQLRTAETEHTNLQAAQAALVEEKNALAKQNELLRKNATEDKKEADKKILDRDARIGEKESEIAQLKDSIERWKTGYEKASELARAVEAERTKLASENIQLRRLIVDREGKNRALFVLGNEILTRYEQFGLGNAILAKEPFIGSSRVKLENLVQDYQDKMIENRVRAGGSNKN